jgi:peptidoglycan hydrolase CwlO-like protein
MRNYVRIILISIAFVLTTYVTRADDNQINTLNQQIEQIQAQIQQYQEQIDTTSKKAGSLANEISILTNQMNKIQLEIKSLNIAIDQTNQEISLTQGQIGNAESKIGLHESALGKSLQNLYQIDQENFAQILLKNSQLSDFFNNLRNIEDTEANLKNAINSIKDIKTDLEDKETKLQDKRSDLEDLQQLQASERDNLKSTENYKNQLLKKTKGEEARYQTLVAQSKQDIERIKTQITYLQQNGVSAEDAIKYGQLAAIGAGIRPAFLIAILEVETGLGKNVGTGNWQKDMYQCYLKINRPDRAATEKNAFLQITTKLGLDPDSVKVSREPNYGCGGAMGPAQFLPSIWLAYESRVATITGHNPPNPWNIQDAFTASAIKLAQGGATSKDTKGESAAARAYIGGSPNCKSSICNYYANTVANKAAIIAQSL